MIKLARLFILFLTFIISVNSSASNPALDNNYLAKPTGKYEVGFQDFHWINLNICPDPMFNGKNQDEFSSNNPKHCHEIVARIYYPTYSTLKPDADYYQPFINSQKDGLAHLSNITVNCLSKTK